MTHEELTGLLRDSKDLFPGPAASFTQGELDQQDAMAVAYELFTEKEHEQDEALGSSMCSLFGFWESIGTELLMNHAILQFRMMPLENGESDRHG